jgi:predicted dehydrogenase
MPKDRLKVGVVGLGMGEWHAEAYKKIDKAELVAVCDADAGWAEHIRAKYEVPKCFGDFSKMIEMKELDAVSVATPTFLHLPMAKAAFAAGKHVLMEKPIALNAAEAEAMATAAKKAGKTLMLSLNQRFDADVQYLKRYIGEGHLGEIYFARTLWRRPLGGLPDPEADRPTGRYVGRNWFNELSKGGGSLRDLGPHVIDVALWLMGYPELEDAFGRSYNKFLPDFLEGTKYKGDADDHAAGYARFKNGASLQFEVSFGQHIDHDEVVTELFGSKGGALRWAGRPPKLYGMAGGAYSTTEPRLNEKRRNAQTEFVEAVLENRPPLVLPEHGIEVMRIIDAVYAGGVK